MGVGVAAAVVLIALSVSSFTSTEILVASPTGDLGGEIEVGLLVALSGDLSSTGEQAHSAAKIAEADFNEYLAESGEDWTLKLVIEDTQTSPVIALEKATSLNAKGIGVIVGPGASASVKNIKGYSDANNLLILSYSSTAPSLALPNDSVYRTVPDDEKQGPAIANVMYDQGIRATAIIYRADAWGDGLQKTSSEGFTSLGGTVSDPIRYNPTTSEFSVSVSLLADQVRDLVDEYGEDQVAVLLIGFAESLQIMQSAANEEILDGVRWFGTDANTNAVKITDDPIGRDFATTTQFTTVQFATSDNPITAKVKDLVADDIGRTPSVYAYTSYDAVWLAGLSIMEAQSTNAADVKSVIHSVAAERVGASGSNELNAAGDLAAADYDIWGVPNGEWSIIGKYVAADKSVNWNTVDKLSGEISVGVLVGQSGDLSAIAEEIVSGFNTAEADFNEYLAESGEDWTLKLVIEDTQTSPVVALEKITSFNAKGIGVIVGPIASANVQNIKGYADANNILIISPGSTAPTLALPNDSVYRTIPDDTKQGPAIANVMHNQGIQALAMIYRADAWGDGLQKTTSENFESLGGTVADPNRYNPTTHEYSVSVSVLAEQVQSLVDEHGADKVGVSLIGFAESLQIMQAASQYDILSDVRWFGTDANTNDVRVIQDEITREFIDSVQFTTVQFATANNPITENVRADVVKDIGRNPGVYTFTSYDAVWLAGLSIMEAQSTNAADVKSVIHSVAAERVGASGSNELNAAGDLAAADYDVWSVPDGEWSIIGKYTAANNALTWN